MPNSCVFVPEPAQSIFNEADRRIRADKPQVGEQPANNQPREILDALQQILLRNPGPNHQPAWPDDTARPSTRAASSRSASAPPMICATTRVAA